MHGRTSCSTDPSRQPAVTRCAMQSWLITPIEGYAWRAHSVRCIRAATHATTAIASARVYWKSAVMASA